MKRAKPTLIAAALIVTLTLCCAAQAQVGSLDDLESKAGQSRQRMVAQPHPPEANPEEIMDAAFDMKKAAERADELAADGAKYCDWGKARVDASDLDVAISRHLLNHGTRVPEHILASKMLRVSFIAADLMHQLELGETRCALTERYSSKAHSFFQTYASIAFRFKDSRFKFDQLAHNQALWQEEANLDRLRRGERSDTETLKVVLQSVLVAARAMKEAAEAADEVTQESRKVSECIAVDPSRASLDTLAALIDGIEHGPNDYLLLATNMRSATLEAESAELLVTTASEGCSLYAAEKKKARNMAAEALDAHRRLVKSIVEFEPLVVRQAEWEEQMVQKQSAVEEQ